MLANYDSDWNIENLTDVEIYAAIRYLEPDAGEAERQSAGEGEDYGVVICVCLYIVLFACIGFWLCWR